MKFQANAVALLVAVSPAASQDPNGMSIPEDPDFSGWDQFKAEPADDPVATYTNAQYWWALNDESAELADASLSKAAKADGKASKADLLNEASNAALFNEASNAALLFPAAGKSAKVGTKSAKSGK